MKPLVRDILRFLECVALGLWIAVMAPVLAGGVYEVVTGGPSYGFLFVLMLFVVSWFAAVMAVVPAACWKVRKSLLMCRWASILMLVVLALIRFYNLSREKF